MNTKKIFIKYLNFFVIADFYPRDQPNQQDSLVVIGIPELGLSKY